MKMSSTTDSFSDNLSANHSSGGGGSAEALGGKARKFLLLIIQKAFKIVVFSLRSMSFLTFIVNSSLLKGLSVTEDT